MPVTAVVGTQWGDEAKGRMVDLLARDAAVVIRFQGGANAGHTLVNEHGRHVLHLIPSGIFHPHVLNLIGPGVVVDPQLLWEEMDSLRRAGIEVGGLRISERAHVVLPYHVLLEKAEEERRAAAKFGSTLRGIAPAYGDKVTKVGLQMSDLLDRDYLWEKIQALVRRKNEILGKLYGAAPLDSDRVFEWAWGYGQHLAPYIGDVLPDLDRALKCDEHILLEGQLGAMRDLDWGSYPYTTSSSPLAGFASVGAGIPPYRITRVIGVAKAYSTCVGAAPFPTEQANHIGETLRERGREYGATTGRPRRCGWFDAVATRYGARVTGATSIALTLLDVLDGFQTIQVCTGYRIGGQIVHTVPVTRRLSNARPVYEEWEGWCEPISEIRRLEDLPPSARGLVTRIQELIRVPIEYISVGPERDQIIPIHTQKERS